jgi:APA family basic amino acid/polyamine antiporter
MRGIRVGRIVQNIFTFAKSAALLGLILLGLLIARNPEAVSANAAIFWDSIRVQVTEGGALTFESLSGMGLLAAIGVAMVGSLFSSDAWNNVTFTAGEVVNPRKTIPLSLALGTGIVTVLYLLANVAYILILPLRGSPEVADVVGRGIQFAAQDRVGTAAATLMFGAPAAAIMGILIMISTFGCNNGLILSGARVYYAMARDRLFFSRTGKLNDKGVPAIALAVQAIWASFLCLTGTYGDLLDYVIFAVLIFYILTVAGIFILRRKRPDAERPYRALGYPVLPALYIMVAAAIAFDLLILKPRFTWPGVIIVLLGIPVYFIWRYFAASRDRASS